MRGRPLLTLIVFSAAGCGDEEPTSMTLADCSAPAVEDLVSLAQLEEWVTLVSESSPNRSGDASHSAYVDNLEALFAAMGAEVASTSHSLTDQSITGASLTVRVGGNDVDAVVSAIPRAGLGAVQGPLVWVPAAWSDAPSVEAAIVVRPLPTQALPVDGLLGDAWSVYDPTGSLSRQPEYQAGASFERPWLSSGVEPDLREAQARGARGVIYTRSLAAEDVADMWSQTALLDIPAVQVGQPQSTSLISALTSGASAQGALEVTGERGPFSARSLRVEVPGPNDDSPVVVVQTHTDSLNAVQENGGPALLALLQSWIARPAHCNEVALRLELSAAHRNGLAGALSADQGAVELGDRLAAIISVEHLGAREYVVSEDGDGIHRLESTGRLEPSALTFPSDRVELAEFMEQRAAKRQLDRMLFLDGGGSVGYFGESKVFAQRGRPAFELISGPWVQNSPRSGMEAIDFVDMRRKIGFLLDLVLAVSGESARTQ